MILWYIFPQKTFMRKQLFSDFVFWLFGAMKWYLCYLCVSGNSKSSKTTFFARILWLSMKGIILRNAQLFACSVNILRIFFLFLKLFSYFCKRIHLLYLNSATLWFNFIYKYLSNKKLLRILPCQIFHLS